jgi:hypothetical protein
LAAKPRNPKLRSLPKAEVHVHLEGYFEAVTLERWPPRRASQCREHASDEATIGEDPGRGDPNVRPAK